VKGINNPKQRKGENKMQNEAKDTEKTNIGEAKPTFQQTEPAEINEADPQTVSGGASVDYRN